MPTSKRDQFTVPLKCPNCGQVGSAVWEEDDGHTKGQNAPRKLLRLSNGFHTEKGRTHSGDPIIVCDPCDEIQPD
jgi:hypothetical protein